MTQTYFRVGSCTVAAAALAVACLFNSGCGSTAPAATEQTVPKVTVATVKTEETTDFDEYTGKTEASEIVEVRARVSGFLKTIDFKDGDYVKEGKQLFTIEPDEYDAIHAQSASRVKLYESKRDLAKAKLARDEVLIKSKAISQEEYEEGVAAYREATAAITAAEADAARTALDVKYTVANAPLEGRIDRAYVARGNLLTGGLGSGTLLTKIVKEQPMHVYFDVDERSLLGYMRKRPEKRETEPGSLRDLKMVCLVRLADEKEFKHEGLLDFASSEVDTGTGTARIRGEFPNLDRSMASGLFVRIRIPMGKPYPALMIPEQALLTDQSIKYVYVVGGDGTATRQTVELGTQQGEMRIIRTGLKAGDRIIVKGQQRVRPGQKVEAEEQKAAPKESQKEAPAADTVKPAATQG